MREGQAGDLPADVAEFFRIALEASRRQDIALDKYLGIKREYPPLDILSMLDNWQCSIERALWHVRGDKLNG